MKKVASLRERIQAQYDALSLVERKLADVVLAHEKDALAYSATELAALAGVSKASSARFFAWVLPDFRPFANICVRARCQARRCSAWRSKARRAAPCSSTSRTMRSACRRWQRM